MDTTSWWLALVGVGVGSAGAVALRCRFATRSLRARLAAAEAQASRVAAAAAAARVETEERHGAETAALVRELEAEQARHAETTARARRQRTVARRAYVQVARQARLDEAALQSRDQTLARLATQREQLERSLAETVAARMEEEQRSSALLALGLLVHGGARGDTVRSEAEAVCARRVGASPWGWFEPDAASGGLRLVAGEGWTEGRVGRAIIAAGCDFLGGVALRSATPVVVDALLDEVRFVAPPLFVEHGVASAVLARMALGPDRMGVLVLCGRQPRKFAPRDVAFVSRIAALLDMLAARARAADALADARARADAIADIALDGVLVLDELGRVESAGAAAEEMFGAEPGRLAGRGIASLLPGVGVEGDLDIARAMQSSFREPTDIHGLASGMRPDGTTFRAEVAVTHLALAAGRKFVVVVRDLAAATCFPVLVRDPWRRFAPARPAPSLTPPAIPLVAAGRANLMMARVFDAAAPVP